MSSQRNTEGNWKHCCVPECKVNSHQNELLHPFPNENDKKRQWMSVCCVPFDTDESLFACGHHFTKDDYLSGEFTTSY